MAPGVRTFALQTVRRHGAYIALPVIQACLLERDDVGMTLKFVESQRWIWLVCIAQVALARGAQGAHQFALADSLRSWLSESGSWFQDPNGEQFAYLVSSAVTDVLERLLCNDAVACQRLAMELERYRPRPPRSR